jgi:hypothetical protein
MPTYIVYYSQGSSNGPFDIYLSGSSGLNLYASNVQKYQLVNGYQVTFPDGVPSSSIDVFDISYGCFTDQNVPFPTPSPTVTPTISITPSKTPTISLTPTTTPTRTVTPSATPSITPPPSGTPSITPSVTVSSTPNPTPTVTRTPSASAPVRGFLWMGTCSNSYTQAYLACAAYNTCTGYYTIYSYLSVGTIVYTDFACTIPYTALNSTWLGLSLEGTGPIKAVLMNNSGLIVDIANCTNY